MKKFTQLFLPLALAAVMISCAASQPMLTVEPSGVTFAPGTIVDTRSRKTVTFDALIEDLASVPVVYVGEHHTDPAHHRVQLKIIDALAGGQRPLSVGMEMFDTTYAPVLDRWSAGDLDQEAFIEQTHWYANWRYDFTLYAEILETVQHHRLPLIGLNIPFHIPPKIAAGGIDSILPPDRQFIPGEVDLSDAGHRAYLEEIFTLHRMKNRSTFDYFYEAQCVWEEAMAEAVAAHLGDRRMVVLAGRGHIAKKFGLPNRAFRRTGAPFRTIVPVPAGGTAEWSDGDYLWVTEP